MEKRKKSINKKQQKLFTVVGAILLILVGVTVAYAALSSTLNITINKVTQTAQNWDVHFKGSSASGVASKTGSGVGTDTSGISCGAATISGTSVTIANTTLRIPGDTCTYTLTVENSGSIDATLAQITKIGTSCGNLSGASFICGTSGSANPYVTYKLTTSNGTTELSTGGTVAKSGGTQEIKLIIQLNPTATSVPSTAVSYTGVGFSLLYGQA